MLRRGTAIPPPATLPRGFFLRSHRMLGIFDPRPAQTCQGYSRRELLRIGSLGLFGGLSLPGLLRARPEAGSSGSGLREKSVVLLFLQGGPSHIEFFDPKMTAPEDIRSMTGITCCCEKLLRRDGWARR